MRLIALDVAVGDEIDDIPSGFVLDTKYVGAGWFVLVQADDEVPTDE